MRALALAAVMAVAVSAFSQDALDKAVASLKGPSTTAGGGAQDALLAAMQQELAREKELLVLPGMQRPYYMEYRIDDFVTWEALANYGALTREERNHQRIVRVVVRIGDYTSDSSSSRGEGSVQLAPEDNNPEALKYALWTATDEAYKASLRAYANKQAQLKRFEKQPTEKDFAPVSGTPVSAIEPLVPLQMDEPEWKRRIVEASGVFLTDPALKASAEHVQYSSASARGYAVNRYLVNTEGALVRHGYAGYSANISVGSQAEDGMRLDRSNGTTGARAADLESATAFRRRAVEDVASLEALRNAPVADAEDYHGPVLFSGDASTDILNSLFVPYVQADRPEMGTTARTVGIYQSSYKAQVLPALLDVVDDPRMAEFKGQSLVGAYKVDDEGVPAQAVDVVKQGKLVSYLTSRTPIRDFSTSNGHGRAAPGQSAHAVAGVIVFKATTPLSPADMHAKLLAMAKEQGRDVYEAETLGGELQPRMLYRVHPDGTRQLVRGASFDELDNRSLRSDIVAAGSDLYVQNTLGAVPETTIAPSLLFGDIGVKRATEEQQKLPYYAPPQ